MNCSQDIRLEAEGAVYHFRYLDWDTEFFCRKSFLLDVEKSILKPSKEIARLMDTALKNSFVTAKINTSSDKYLLDFLQTTGFKYIDTEVALKYDEAFPVREIKDVDIRIEKVFKNENLPYEEMGSVYSLTRFHHDIHIPREKADAVWIEYFKNYEPAAFKHVFIARCDGEIAGAVLVNENDLKTSAFLFFVAVLERFRDKGIGSKLIRHVTDQFKNHELLTGTQIKNVGALNFYIRNGFSTIKETKTVLHRWSM